MPGCGQPRAESMDGWTGVSTASWVARWTKVVSPMSHFPGRCRVFRLIYARTMVINHTFFGFILLEWGWHWVRVPFDFDDCCQTRIWPRMVYFCCNFRWVLELLIDIFMWGISSISGFASNTKPPCLNLQTPSKNSLESNICFAQFSEAVSFREVGLSYFFGWFTLTGPCWRWVVWYISSRLWEVRSLPSLGGLSIMAVWWICSSSRLGCLRINLYWVVVSKIFYFQPYQWKWSNLTNIFQMGY